MQVGATNKNAFPNHGLDNYFFTTPALRLRLDIVREHIHRGEAPVLILGERGAGKSALLNQLVCRADNNWRIVRIPAVPSFSANDVVTFLNAELRLPTRVSSDEMLREFDAWLDRLATRGQMAVIVIDNAHDLCDEGLARLATLKRQLKATNLSVLMTGKPELRNRLNGVSRSARSPVPVFAISIPSLDQREVASYIDMRLYHAGVEGRGPFSRAAIDDISRDSRGYPGQINAMANDLLNGERKRVFPTLRGILPRLWGNARQNLSAFHDG